MGDSEERRSLGKYHLIARLGQGGMAKVYLALVVGPAGVNKLMVLKVMENELLSGPEGSLELFWDEARLAARLVHPNIVHTYEVGEIDGHYFLAMEHLDGQTYRALRARSAHNRPPLCEELRILSEVARGLHYAHELKDYRGEPLGVVHRDVSPQNVFITYDGQVRLIDFGIAKTQDAAHETRVGIIKGKLNYIAPEQLRGETLDRRADIFALGVMLWELVAGCSFTGGARVAEATKVHARVMGEEPNIRSVRPDVSEELAAIVDRALELNRELRWKDAASFADALDSYLEWSGERPSAKSLSAWMNVIFSEDRTVMHQLIERQVQALSSNPDGSTSELPRLRVTEEGHTASGVWAGERTRGGSRGRLLAGSEGTEGAGGALFSTRGRQAAAAAVVLATASAVVLGLGALFPVGDSKPAPASEAPAPRTALAEKAVSSPSPAPSKPLSEVPANVILQLKVTPPDAQVRIDGAPVSAPFRGEFRRSATLRRIEAVASGYQPYARLVAFDQDRSLEIDLVPAAQAARRPVPARARSPQDRRSAEVEPETPSVRAAPAEEREPEPAVVPGMDISTTKAKLKQIQIDTVDPYANGQ